MYLILGVFMTIGSYVPTLFGQSMFGGWSIFGTLIGGMVGVFVYWKAREAGYIA